MTKLPIILLPPSEGKAPAGRSSPWTVDSGRFGAQLGSRRRQVADALDGAAGGDHRLLGAKGELLEQARVANRSVIGAPTLPAWQRFSGVVWNHLDHASLSPTAKRRARSGVLVISALTGVSGVTDPLPDHRLKLSADLAPLGRLARWWRPAVSEVLEAPLRRRLVVDLLPNEHRAACHVDADRCDLRRIRFVDDSGRSIGHDAKAAKGLFVRALLEADDPESVLCRGWTHGDLTAVQD